MSLNLDNTSGIEDIQRILDYQPSGLSNGEIENADTELEYFFVNFPLHEARAKMKELYEGWVHFEAESPEGEKMTDMLFFYNQIVSFLNFSYIVIRLKQTG